MKLYLLVCLCFLSRNSFSMHLCKTVTQEDLDRVARVEERKSPDFLKLEGVLKDGRKINYSENLSGENVGLATCDTLACSASQEKHIVDESCPDYWYKVLIAKLAQQKGS